MMSITLHDIVNLPLDYPGFLTNIDVATKRSNLILQRSMLIVHKDSVNILPYLKAIEIELLSSMQYADNWDDLFLYEWNLFNGQFICICSSFGISYNTDSLKKDIELAIKSNSFEDTYDAIVAVVSDFFSKMEESLIVK